MMCRILLECSFSVKLMSAKLKKYLYSPVHFNNLKATIKKILNKEELTKASENKGKASEKFNIMRFQLEQQ
jgi:hypothetical protein